MLFIIIRDKIIKGFIILQFVFHLLFAITLCHAQGGVEGELFDFGLIEQNKELLGISDGQLRNLDLITKAAIEKTADITREAEIVLATLSDFSWGVGRNDSLLIRCLFQDYYRLLIKKKEAEMEALNKIRLILTSDQLAILGSKAYGDSVNSQDK